MGQAQTLKKMDFGKIGVLLGGSSRERAISLRSGRAVYEALKQAGLHVVLIDTANGSLSGLKRAAIDLAFVALHGVGGEDGTIQKILNSKRIPYVGSGPKASALAFDKARAKEMFLRVGIPTPSFEVLTLRDWRKKLQKWNLPYVIKPVCEGSSIGVFFAEKSRAIGIRIRSLFRRYQRLLVEEKIGGREFTVGILGTTPLPVIELKPKRPFYDYKAKYTKGLTEYLIPAPISQAFTTELQSMAVRAHEALGLRDMSRVDFKVDPSGQPFVLEVNSIPGFSETSLLPKAAQCAGFDFTQLCLRLLELARERERVQKSRNGETSITQVESEVFA